MSNDTYLLSVRVQTTINHISICFLPQQRQRKCFSSERELKKALRDTQQRGMDSKRLLVFQCLNVML